MVLEILGSCLLCLLVADIITGIAHWLEDTYCENGYPIIGELICEPNELHHQDPNLIGKTSNFFKRNILQWAIAIIPALLLASVGYGYWQCYLTLFLASMGNQVHFWNHQSIKEASPISTFFSDSGMIQTRKQHNKHHTKPHDKYYCVLVNFNNAWMERIRFWKSLEFLLLKIFGLTIKNKDRISSV